jgi:hypothetical protein
MKMGGATLRPYGFNDPYDPMDMIGHDHEFLFE